MDNLSKTSTNNPQQYNSGNHPSKKAGSKAPPNTKIKHEAHPQIERVKVRAGWGGGITHSHGAPSGPGGVQKCSGKGEKVEELP